MLNIKKLIKDISFQAGFQNSSRVKCSSFYFTKKLIFPLLGNVINFNIVGCPKTLYLVKLK